MPNLANAMLWISEGPDRPSPTKAAALLADSLRDIFYADRMRNS